MGLAYWLNTAWMLKCAVEARAFRRAARRPERTQEELLRDIVRANRDTAFGRAHSFDRVDSPRSYQQRVPLSTYEDYADPVARIAAGEKRVLTREPVRLLEPTSGTTGGEKLIPYTDSLRGQFQRGVAAWVADLFRHRPAVRRGRAYWSVSPALGPRRRTPGGLPIGFDDDAAYLGSLERLALDRLLVVPAAVARVADMEAFRYATLLALLRAEDLALVSVWSPSFLTALLAPLEGWLERLCADVRRGTVSPPTRLSAPLAAALAGPPDPRRAARLVAVFRGSGPLPGRLRETWPRLALISCWADAAAARALVGLRELFPGVEVQPKGLIATEGFVSFPLCDRPGAALALRCHFFEFEEFAAGAGRCRLAHELDCGGRYRVVLTTGGGLYRYQLRDEVDVVGFEGRCPLLRFVGKSDRVSDLVGEKLAEPHVRGVLERAFARHGVSPHFALLVPVNGTPAFYRLYVQGRDVAVPPAGLAGEVEAGLEENPYYRHAVRLGQLAPAEVLPLDPAGQPGWLVYERRCRAAGQKAGDVKPTALAAGPGWEEEFRPLCGAHDP